MSTTQTVGGIGSGTVIETLAHLEAAEEILVALNDNTAPSKLSEPLGEAKYGLWLAAFGPQPDGDEEYEADAIVVEVTARGYEIAAAALKEAFADAEPVVLRGGVDAARELRSRVYQLESWAARIRERGTIGGGDG